MDTFTLWCSFIGSWLLVAGPVYQASIELSEERIESEHFKTARQNMPPMPRVSAWWWLLPPVKIYLQQRRSDEWRKTFLRNLPDEDVETMIAFNNKATGWLYVAGGGLLLALHESYQLVEHFGWNLFVYWLGCLVIFVLSILNTIIRSIRSEKVKRKVGVKD